MKIAVAIEAKSYQVRVSKIKPDGPALGDQLVPGTKECSGEGGSQEPWLDVCTFNCLRATRSDRFT